MLHLQQGPLIKASIIGVSIYALFFILKKIIQKNENRSDGLLMSVGRHTNHLFLISTALYLGLQFYPMPAKYDKWIDRLYFVIFMWQFAIWGNSLISKWLDQLMTRRMKKDPSAATSISLMQFISKAIFFIFTFLFTLHNLGVEITAMIAGLGVGGIAVALALQNILGDLFSSLSIVLDKPFVVGDFIVMNEWQGTVERIGLKTTRLRSLSGEQIIVSNSDLLGSRIRNYKRMIERRVPMNFYLSQESSPDQISWACEMIAKTIQTKPHLRFERCHFIKITPSAYEIEAVYWVVTPDADIHMNLQQTILLEILTSLKGADLKMGHHTHNIQFASREFFKDLRGDKMAKHQSLS